MKRILNDGWTFTKLPNGSGYADAMKAELTPVDLPHDWLIWQAQDLYESADAWYCRKLDHVPDPGMPVTLLYFDGVYMDCDVLLNGEVLCTHPYGYTAFFVDLSDGLRAGENTVLVHIRHRSPNSRWYSGSGIYRDVTLIRLPASHLIPDSLYVIDHEREGAWTLDVSAETAGADGQSFRLSLVDREGNTVAETAGEATDHRIEACLSVPGARTWSPEDPYLYTLKTEYGKQTEVCRIGLRSLRFDPHQGLLLNGRVTKLRGACLHHDLGALGAAFHEKAARRQLVLMRDMGVNAIRTSHNPPAARFLDLCDEMGFLVIDEAFDMWERAKTEFDYARFFPEWYKRDVASWVRRDRCHPCVIMWSIGNEIYDVHADLRGTEVTRLLAAEVRRHDPEKHAAVTFGSNYMPWEGGQRCAGYLDTVGYNYGEKYYDQHHEQYPDWVIYGSETASVLSSRGIYHFPIGQSIMSEADMQCSALGNSNTSWGATDLKTMIIDDLHNAYSMGQFIWSGIDYIGEPTPYHTRSCYFGQADTACYPKDAFYLFQSFWTEAPMIHIGVSWDWNPGQIIDVPVMTNCAEAELFLNGESLGRRKRDVHSPETCQPLWKVPFRAGMLEVKGYDAAGKILCQDRKTTPGEPRRLVLRTENDHLIGDGWDLAFVHVAAEDENGIPVENARERISVSVSGGGCLMGTDNGDSTDPDGYKSASRQLFSGKLLLIIGSTGSPEPVTVRVAGNRCEGAEITLPVICASPAEGRARLQRIPQQPGSSRIPVRRLLLAAEGDTRLTPDHPECAFRFSVLPAEAAPCRIVWQAANAAGIESPFVTIREEDGRVMIRAEADGEYYLRGLCMEREGIADIISQMEFSVSGIGRPAMDPYTYVSAGLYDLSRGDIGTGNEKGIAFSRDGVSLVGFSRIDFGAIGSDQITADIFALNGDLYEIELFSGLPDEGGRLISVLRYQKPSIWNVYQPETWKLPERLTGMHTLCFRMRDKVHMKGFVFARQSRAWDRLAAGSADELYGDSFRRDGDAVRDIGNNVTLTWKDMDFGNRTQADLEIEGSTPLPVNTIQIRIRGAEGTEVTGIADFPGSGEGSGRFRVPVLPGLCSVSLVFLPGSHFDLLAFRFIDTEAGQNGDHSIE